MEEDRNPSKNSVSGTRKLSEEEILKLLDKIHERTGVDNALVFRYRFHALFPGQGIFEDDKFTMKEGYLKLRQHEQYYQYALSMVVFLIESYGSKGEIELLMEHVKSSSLYETDIRNGPLNLWRLLTNIATDLKENEKHVRCLVDMVGQDLSINTDHIAVGGKYSLAAVLKAFQNLEEKEKLKPMLNEHPKEYKRSLYFYQLLRDLNQKKLIKTYMEDFNPHQPITLSVLEVKSEWYYLILY